jgi:membrane-associated phospholipid phosphatase
MRLAVATVAVQLARGTQLGRAMGTYVRQPGFGGILAFLMLYRVGEAMASPMVGLFLLDKTSVGGLGMSLGVTGQIQGVAGVVGIIVGGLVGGWVVARLGLNRALWPLAVSMHAPNLLYLWAAVAAIIVLRTLFQPDTNRVRRGVRRGVFLFLCFAVPGVLAEVLKSVFGRLRPEAADGHYIFQWFEHTSVGHGLPSSHAATAVGACLAMGVLAPTLRPLWLTLAIIGCLARIAAGAHYLSDVILGGLVALACFRMIHQLDLRNNQGVPIGPA